MKKIIYCIILAFFTIIPASAQDKSQDVFTPIGKYIQAGDYESLSAWFADNLELEILGSANSCTRNQAKLIMKNFFIKYTPKKFTVIHKSGKSPMKYAVGTLSAGGENFRVILFVKSTPEKNYLEQIKVEKE
ncbi:MAG: DUF4783 domain-containing protein [Bacteroidales bacterium]|nr:DUF4783 domain-containing protein [Candidatus Cacconaster merdequi]